MLGEMTGATRGSLVIEPSGAMVVNGNLVSCPVRFTVKSVAETVDMSDSDLHEVTNGKIVQVWLFLKTSNIPLILSESRIIRLQPLTFVEVALY